MSEDESPGYMSEAARPKNTKGGPRIGRGNGMESESEPGHYPTFNPREQSQKLSDIHNFSSIRGSAKPEFIDESIR